MPLRDGKIGGIFIVRKLDRSERVGYQYLASVRAARGAREKRMTEHAGAPSLFKSDNRIQDLAAEYMMLCGFFEDALC